MPSKYYMLHSAAWSATARESGADRRVIVPSVSRWQKETLCGYQLAR
jgi:hypothetical protein